MLPLCNWEIIFERKIASSCFADPLQCDDSGRIQLKDDMSGPTSSRRNGIMCDQSLRQGFQISRRTFEMVCGCLKVARTILSFD